MFYVIYPYYLRLLVCFEIMEIERQNVEIDA